MFQPPLFREDRIEVMHALMRAHPFATLVNSATGPLTADHVPLVLHPELSETGTLRGHLAAANPLWRAMRDRGGTGPIEVLAVFQGPQTYVTPSWYPSKKAHGKVVPTWNYAVVHAHGTLRFHDETDWLMAHLSELTNRQESHRPEPWAVTDAPDDFTAKQLKGLIGFEIAIDSLTGTWKVSQNKSGEDREGLERGLLAENTEEAAAILNLVRQYAE